MVKNNLQLQHYRCQRCDQALATIAGRQLIISALVRVDRGCRLRCECCGYWQTWQGGKGKPVAAPAIRTMG